MSNESAASPEQAASNAPPILTVSELAGQVRHAIEDRFGLVRVRGELSGVKRAGSGHVYMALKDVDSVIDAVAWRGTAQRLAVMPEDGLDVIATGRLTTYPARSRYQLIVEQMEMAGEGALLKMIEERRKRLAAEGLFDAARKRKLPYLPEVIGVVTSPTGAVIRDILHRLADRFPRRVLLWPVLVQGNGAAEQVAAAIDGFSALAEGGAVPRPDVVIVARGGGSLEDLMAFNEEIVVRAIAASTIPVISAVGHETDTTLADFASDMRAPTPTAAAEMAVPVRADLLLAVDRCGGSLAAAAVKLVRHRAERLAALARGLPDARRAVGRKAQRADEWAERLGPALARYLDGRTRQVGYLGQRLPAPRELVQRKRQSLAAAAGALTVTGSHLRTHLRREAMRLDREGKRLARGWSLRRISSGDRLAALASLLASYSYRAVLARGFVLVRDAAGVPVLRAAAATTGSEVKLTFADGEVGARIAGDAPAPQAPSRPQRPARRDGRQGDLL
ncbi:MAG: exodeoxyribonuclease VII large subunit [Alphaproteobacteria bacterium]|nr:exodeoxyribonuclease VII large subunit [Alphaproteobacteria bacterium]